MKNFRIYFNRDDRDEHIFVDPDADPPISLRRGHHPHGPNIVINRPHPSDTVGRPVVAQGSAQQAGSVSITLTPLNGQPINGNTRGGVPVWQSEWDNLTQTGRYLLTAEAISGSDTVSESITITVI
jgi:hypothetical protein